MSFNKYLSTQIHLFVSPSLLKGALLLEKILYEHNFECYLVGGSVRDIIFKKKIHDLDFTTNATPQQIINIFSKTIPVGIQFGTVLVLLKGHSFEVTTYRKESNYVNGRHPEKVTWGISLQEDVIRRDFTINGMAYSLSNQFLYDFVNGMHDIREKVLRTIGNPLDRFLEDGLRPIRGYRFAATFSLNIDPEINNAVQLCLSVISSIAVERFYEEWKKTLSIQNKYFFWKILYQQNVFQIFFPKRNHIDFYFKQEIFLKKLLNESKIYSMKIYFAYFIYLDNLNNHKTSTHYSYLLEKSISKKLIFRFPFLQNLFKKSALLVSSPFFLLDLEDIKTVSKKKIRFILHQIPKENIVLHFRFFYNIQKTIFQVDSKELIVLFRKIKKILLQEEALYLKDLKVSGTDILNLGIKGRQIAIILNNILEEIIKENLENNQKTILQYVKHKYL